MSKNSSRNAAEPKLSPFRWVVLFGAWASFTLTSIDRSTWGPASVFVGEGLSIPLASLGAFATAYYIGYVVSNAIGGFATDNFGGRITLTISLFGAGILMFCFGSATSAVVGISIQAAVGFFAGADYSAGIRLITSWFRPHEHGLAMGIFTTATSLGTAIANLIVPALIARSGWETSYHLFGGISVGMAILVYFIAKPGPLLDASAFSRRKQNRSKPQYSSLLRNRNFLLTCFGGFGAFWGLYGFVTWSNALMIKGYRIDPVTAGLVVSIFSLAAIFSKPIIGFTVDRLFKGARRIPIATLFGMFGIMLLVFGALRTPAAFFIAAPFLGFFAYGWSPLLVSLVPRVVHGSVTGSASGLANATWQLGSVFAPTAIGAVFASTGSFYSAFVTLACGPLLGLIIILFVKESKDPHHAAQVAAKEKV